MVGWLVVSHISNQGSIEFFSWWWVKPCYHHEQYTSLPTYHMSKVKVLDLILQQLELSFPQRYYQKCHKKTNSVSGLGAYLWTSAPKHLLSLYLRWVSQRERGLRAGVVSWKAEKVWGKGISIPSIWETWWSRSVCDTIRVRKRNEKNTRGQHSLPVLPFDLAFLVSTQNAFQRSEYSTSWDFRGKRGCPGPAQLTLVWN